MRTYPLSQTQLGIFLADANRKEGEDYDLRFLYIMDDGIDLKRLQQALTAVVEAHPYIKGRIIRGADGEPVITVNDGDVFVPAIIPVDNIDKVRASLLTPLNLDGGDLFRLEIYKTAEAAYLYFSFSHIIMDGSGRYVFRDELMRAYAGEAIVPEDVCGGDVAVDEDKLRTPENLLEAREWYTQTFGGVEASSEPLPDVYDEDAPHAFRRIAIPVDIPYDEVKTFCEQQGVSRSALFNTAFGYELQAYTAEDEVVFSTINNGRDKRSCHTFSMMVKTLPVRVSKVDVELVADLVKTTDRQQQEVLQRSYYSYGEVCSDCEITSQVCFAYQGHLAGAGIMLDGKEQQKEDLRNHEPGVGLSFQLRRLPDHYLMEVEYPQNLYTETFIRHMAETFAMIVKGMVSHERLCEIELVNEEQTALLDTFNHETYQPSGDETIVSLFRKAASQYPDHVAAVIDDKTYTYAQLDKLTDRLSAYLFTLTRDVQREKVVSILIHRNEYMFIASLAALKAGCAYQPLDPSYPTDRLNFMIKDADACLLIADDDLRPVLNEYEGETLLTSALPAIMEGECAEMPAVDIRPDSLLTLLYTSGSTGVPKGVMIEHRNLIAFGYSFYDYLSVNADSKIAAYASFGFDANMMDIFCTLTCGATLVVIPEDKRLDLAALHECFEQQGVTHCFMTTQVGVQFLEAYPQSASLQHLVMGGEKLRAVHPEALSYAIHNGYGPSETTCGTSLYPVKQWHSNIPIGKPLPSCSVYIINKTGHRLPPGAAGELVIVGPQVSRGYLNRPDKTAEAFFEWEGRRAYHSGDIVRYRNDGNIEFVGRKDGQVKIRGFRIELKEVEAVIRQYPGVIDVTVQAFDYPEGGKFIAAYVVSSETIDTMALNAFISSQKPPYMVPAVTMQIEKIPLTVNQKVDKKALPKPEVQKTATEAPAAPLNVLEEAIKSIVADILHNDSFSITDQLQYFGLSSISAIRLAAQIYKRFGIQIDSKNLMTTGTIQSIENELLAVWMSGEGVAPVAQAQQAKPYTLNAETEAPLTHSQIGVYTECLAAPDSTIYNVPFMISLPAGIEADAVKKALRTLVDAHPQLKARFTSNANGDAVQRFVPDMQIDIEVAESQDLETLKKHFVRPFDLAQGPLVRFIFVKDKALLVDVHHLVADGASIDLFTRQLCELLNGGSVEQEQYPYFQFANEQTISDADKAYFDQQLGGIEEISTPLPDIYDSNDEHLCGQLAADLSLAEITAFSHTIGVNPSAVLLAATYCVTSCYTGEQQVSLCTISNGRSNLRTMNTMGMFVNTLGLVSDVNPDLTATEFIKRTHQEFTETLRHENYPFAAVSRDYGFRADVVFAYQVNVISNYQVHDQAITIENLELSRAKFPLYIYVTGDENGMGRLHVDYDTSLYSQQMMESLLSALCMAAKGLLRTGKLSDLMLTDEQANGVLDSFNAKVAPYTPTDETIVSLFRKAAAEHPDHVAVVFKEKSLTYGELDCATDALAAYIHGRVSAVSDKQEKVVSILIHRNENMVVAALAALKAGCAYQPLDPSYPAERLNFMIQDAQASLLIADNDLRPIIDQYHGEELLTSDIPAIASGAVSCSMPLPEAHNLFILLYTSGSTGTPKGVMLEHRNLVAFCSWYKRYYGLTANDRVAAYASFGFDACMMDLYPALTTGAAVYIVPEEMRLDLVELNRYFCESGITHSFMTTQVGVQFLQGVKNDSLRHLSVGGEKLVSVEPDQSYTFHNGYGPTECTIFSTTMAVSHAEKNIPIGKPVDALDCYVVDKHLHRQPLGAVGELIIVGEQVGRGYLNLPDKTAESFFEWKGRRAYHSGDIVRYRRDGNIEFVGRKDGQVKVRGFRIELKEVEAVIRSYHGIDDVTVQAFDDPQGGKFIAAYIVSAQPVDIEQLNAFIAGLKPAYMVPAVTMQIDTIPLNVNQKVDRKALPQPVLSVAAGDEEFVAPRGTLEEKIAECFAETLGLESPVSATDGFTYLGGTSVKAIKLVTLLRNKGLEISMGQVLRQNTVRDIALAADFYSRSEFIEQKHPLLPAQTRMLNHYILSPDSEVDRRGIIFDIDTDVTEGQLREAIDAWSLRHEELTRSIVYANVDTPFAVSLSGRVIPLHYVDLSEEPDAIGKMESLRADLRVGALELQTKPLMHFVLGRVSATTSYLLVVYHAIIAEDWRIGSWIGELFGELSKGREESSLNTWSDLLTMYEQTTEESERECWSTEIVGTTEGHLTSPEPKSDDREDNFFTYSEHEDKKHLVFVHTGNTGSEAYASLAEKIKDDYSFSILDQYNIYHQNDVLHGIPAIASKYVDVLRQHQHHGPYYLGGWCYGGMIAYEMACQLREMGEKVDTLILFDAHSVKNKTLKKRFTAKTGEMMRDYFQNSPLFEDLLRRGLLNAMVSNSLQVNRDMMQYRPRKYDGEVVYFKAITHSPNLSAENMEYFNKMTKKRAGGFEEYVSAEKLHVIDIMQEHDNMMNEDALSVEVPVIRQYVK